MNTQITIIACSSLIIASMYVLLGTTLWQAIVGLIFASLAIVGFYIQIK